MGTAGDLKRDDKTLFIEIGHQIQELLGLVWSEGKIVETIEKFNLDVALKSFMSNNLEKRLRGVKFIRNMVARTTIKEEKNFLSNLWKPKEEKENDVKHVDPKYVANSFALNNQVVAFVAQG